MRSFRLVVAALTAAGLTTPTPEAKAEDASWGCQVLLCAASQNPSWHGVPYCIPPMTKLISAMKEPGFDWPICHEANSGTPGREDFEECPAGTTVGYSSRGDNGRRGEPDQCIKTVDVCRSPNLRSNAARLPGQTIHREGIGYAFNYPGEPQVPAYFDIERKARGLGYGVWSSPDLLPPWLYDASVAKADPSDSRLPESEPGLPLPLPVTTR